LMTKRTVILIVAIVVISLLTVMCASSNGAQAATTDVPPPKTFVDQGTLVSIPSPSLVASTGGATPCWVWRQGWEVTNYLNTPQYRFQVDVEWCANAQKTKVTKLVYNYCVDLGGYFNFDWCH